MLKKFMSISLCAFMLCTMIFTTGVSADSAAANEITAAVFTDELTSTDYIYSYPNAADNWHLEQLTEFKLEGAGTPITAVGYKCGESTDNVIIPDDYVIWYKAGEAGGFDKKFTKAEFKVWIHPDKAFAAGITPIIKVKDSENGTVTNLTNIIWDQTVSPSKPSDLDNVVWTKTANQQKIYDWNCQVTGTVTLSKGAEFIGLGFDADTIWSRYFYLDNVVLYTGSEAVKYYNDGSTLEDAWYCTNLSVVDDVIDAADYKNGGHMISPVATYSASEIVYKIPEGRSFKSFESEVSLQFSSSSNWPKIAYSEDGVTFTDFNSPIDSDTKTIWTKSDRPNSDSNAGNAYWAWKYRTTVTAPENIDVKFIKIYQTGAELNNVIKFLIRKSVLLTEGSIVSEDVTDDLSGEGGALYEISNLMPYSYIAFKNNWAEADSIANETNVFNDSDLLGVEDLTKDAYIIYKAGDGKVFTSIEAQELVRDNNGKDVNIKIYASKNGSDYAEVTPVITNNGYIDNSPNDSKPDGGWNVHLNLSKEFDRTEGYKFIKLLQPASTLTNVKQFKLSSVSLETKTALDSTAVAPGFVESFANTDNLADFKGIWASTEETRFRATSDYVTSNQDKPYAVYKIADGQSFGTVKAVFLMTDIADNPEYVEISALDSDKNVISWDSSSILTKNKYNDGNSRIEYIFYGEVPQNTKYLKLQMNYLYDNWKCVIDDFRVYGPDFEIIYDSSIYSVDGENAETNLNGTLADGNLKGKVSFENVDLGDKTIYAVVAFKDGEELVKAAIKSHTLTEDGEVMLDTPVLSDCVVGENITFEIYLFDVTDGKLSPIMPTKLVY